VGGRGALGTELRRGVVQCVATGASQDSRDNAVACVQVCWGMMGGGGLWSGLVFEGDVLHCDGCCRGLMGYCCSRC
jgi:hypothetical protein